MPRIYHGSNTIVLNPEIRVSGYNKDFGFAFYCTNLYKQAVKWASSRSIHPIVNEYEYTPDPSLKILTFKTMTEQWLDFIADCRAGKPHDYDIVEGPMADDQIWDYVDDFLKGSVSRAAFWELVKFKYPTHQIAFCTSRSLSTIKFGGYKNV